MEHEFNLSDQLREQALAHQNEAEEKYQLIQESKTVAETIPSSPIPIWIVYAEDSSYLEDLKKHLSGLRRNKLVTVKEILFDTNTAME